MATSFYSFQALNLCVIPFLLLLLPPSATSISFQRTRFDPGDTSIIYEGGASANVGRIDFNSDTYMCQVGRATYATKVPLWDSSTARLTDFSTHFSFYIDIEGRTSYAAGFAFFIAPVEFHIPPNSAGGFLGLYNMTTSDSHQNHIVHVEFDSFANPEWDPRIQHVGINNNSVSSATYTYWNTTLHSGDPADVWITYSSTTKNLTVSWKYQTTSTPQENTSLSYIIDLREVLPEWVTIGFTAATSNLIERHVLRSWNFSSTLEMRETSGTNAKNIQLVVGLTVSGAVLIIVVALVSGILWRRKLARKETAETVNLTSINDDLERRAGPRRFSYKDLVSATNNFSAERKLGEGGFGAVYRGQLTARYRISLGLASALLYLHEEWEQCVVHRDVKSSNIMLDSSFNVKLGDFGLARLMDHELGPQTTGLAGTLGYLAPEYISTGRASKESDVYSFGVVSLEIATGRKAVDSIEYKSEMSLVEWIWDLYGTGNLNLAVDEKLLSEFDENQMECLMIVGLWCAHPDRNIRPSIRQVIHVLNSEAPLPDLPSKMPVPLFHVPATPSLSSGENFISHSMDVGR
ncbi:hypothetical protein OIU77_027388 [Salix suchowensis]|uniref:Protein kinase domain-containing protein n=1 Tax=Salix suchowensis TaxID=1278906 RepID=A0ABQ9BPG4_9ROSI|nr:hypothetical protein OIU77_027388 [Salix suchowensis]